MINESSIVLLIKFLVEIFVLIQNQVICSNKLIHCVQIKIRY